MNKNTAALQTMFDADVRRHEEVELLFNGSLIHQCQQALKASLGEAVDITNTARRAHGYLPMLAMLGDVSDLGAYVRVITYTCFLHAEHRCQQQAKYLHIQDMEDAFNDGFANAYALCEGDIEARMVDIWDRQLDDADDFDDEDYTPNFNAMYASAVRYELTKAFGLAIEHYALDYKNAREYNVDIDAQLQDGHTLADVIAQPERRDGFMDIDSMTDRQYIKARYGMDKQAYDKWIHAYNVTNSKTATKQERQAAADLRYQFRKMYGLNSQAEYNGIIERRALRITTADKGAAMTKQARYKLNQRIKANQAKLIKD